MIDFLVTLLVRLFESVMGAPGNTTNIGSQNASSTPVKASSIDSLRARYGGLHVRH